ncbi:flagellin [Tissierella praeacuta]|uniref:flagellin N-terminal helical domain-containing protein n=1 Tax=Tissierella praeacuta TaxID=43131 RepID=UPI002467CECF|nr:flagellin [Tissierella praeacuta]
MRINNNLMAMNTHRQLGISTNAGAKSMEKLSSGYRINRAGDDAAGLAISEKMRGQIRGLNQASRNSQDAISLIQTTEGALNETHAILQRMRELAVQSATDTNTDADRANIQDEIDQLATEITRISTDTEFNTMKLLDGSFEGKNFHIGANEGQSISFDVNSMTAKALGLTLPDKMEGAGAVGDFADGKFISTNADIKEIEFLANDKFATGGGVQVTLEDGKLSVLAAADAKMDDVIAELAKHDITATTSAGDTSQGINNIAAAISIKLEKPNVKVGDLENVEVKVTNSKVTGLEFAANGGGTGEVAIAMDKDGKVTVTAADDAKLEDIQSKLKEMGIEFKAEGAQLGTVGAPITLDIEEKNKAIRVDTQAAASKSITTINSALETVSKERSKLGAIQNRLEHTIKNLDTSAENLQASESRIRDVDMAKEMMEQTRQNILQQASTAMLAQANQAPQTVLQLLR